MLCVPTDNPLGNVSFAIPLTNPTVPRTTPSITNVTLPVGNPAPGATGSIRAVNVTG
jgi:hypothetical protein